MLDSSDVVVQVLDARDPIGTRSSRVEKELQTTERLFHFLHNLIYVRNSTLPEKKEDESIARIGSAISVRKHTH